MQSTGRPTNGIAFAWITNSFNMVSTSFDESHLDIRFEHPCRGLRPAREFKSSWLASPISLGLARVYVFGQRFVQNF